MGWIGAKGVIGKIHLGFGNYSWEGSLPSNPALSSTFSGDASIYSVPQLRENTSASSNIMTQEEGRGGGPSRIAPQEG